METVPEGARRELGGSAPNHLQAAQEGEGHRRGPQSSQKQQQAMRKHLPQAPAFRWGRKAMETVWNITGKETGLHGGSCTWPVMGPTIGAVCSHTGLPLVSATPHDPSSSFKRNPEPKGRKRSRKINEFLLLVDKSSLAEDLSEGTFENIHIKIAMLLRKGIQDI